MEAKKRKNEIESTHHTPIEISQETQQERHGINDTIEIEKPMKTEEPVKEKELVKIEPIKQEELVKTEKLINPTHIITTHEENKNIDSD